MIFPSVFATQVASAATAAGVAIGPEEHCPETNVAGPCGAEPIEGSPANCATPATARKPIPKPATPAAYRPIFLRDSIVLNLLNQNSPGIRNQLLQPVAGG